MDDNTYTLDRLKVAFAAAKKRGQFDGQFPDSDPDIVRLRSLPYFGEACVALRYRPLLARGLTAFRMRFGDHWELVPIREVALVVAELIDLAKRAPEKVQDFTGFSLEKLLQSRDDLKRIVSSRVDLPPGF